MQHLSEIVEEARKKGKKRLAVAYGQDAHTLAAVYAAYKEGLVEPILFGDPKIIEQVCKEENIDCNIFKIICFCDVFLRYIFDIGCIFGSGFYKV